MAADSDDDDVEGSNDDVAAGITDGVGIVDDTMTGEGLASDGDGGGGNW